MLFQKHEAPLKTKSCVRGVSKSARSTGTASSAILVEIESEFDEMLGMYALVRGMGFEPMKAYATGLLIKSC